MDPQRFIRRQEGIPAAASRLQEAVSQQVGDILRDATSSALNSTLKPPGKPRSCF
jgi:hypothetical protein